MEAMSGLTGTDALAVMNSRNGYGYNDGFGADGGWFWIIIILFAFWGNNGWGNRGTSEQVDIDTRFLERDIFNTNQNVSATGCQTQRDVLETKYDLGTQILENRYANQLCCCDTQKEILESRYTTQLGFQNQQANLAQCCCDLKTAIHAEGEETRALITNNTIQDLRDRLTLANNAITSQTLANDIISSVRPYPTPAYLTCSPYMSSLYAYNGFNNNCGGCGCGNNVII